MQTDFLNDDRNIHPNRLSVDVLIVGSGLAGVLTALALDEHSNRYDVPPPNILLISKGRVTETNSYRAQGGISAALGPNDAPKLHARDTFYAGGKKGLLEAIHALTEKAPSLIRFLETTGIVFDRDRHGNVSLHLEGGHSRRRIVHAGGAETGKKIMQTLIHQVKQRKHTTFWEQALTLKLYAHPARMGALIARLDTPMHDAPSDWRGSAWHESETVPSSPHRPNSSTGSFGQAPSIVQTHPSKSHQIPNGKSLLRPSIWMVSTKVIVLASGGIGGLFPFTTNETLLTGDGFALAAELGTMLSDLDLVQYHPTALLTEERPLILLSEALRGEGARLVTDTGEPFHMTVGDDLAPRHQVTEAIFKTRARGKSVLLDARSIPHFKEHFPALYRILTERGLNPAEDLLPVIPAQHSIMGGIAANLSGETSLPRLFAIGEVACTGVHGINRLASNGLLEAGVMAMQAKDALFPYLQQKDDPKAETIIFVMAQETLSLLTEKEKADLVKPRINWLPDHTLLKIIFQHTAQHLTPLSPSERPIAISSDPPEDNRSSLEEALHTLTSLLAHTPRLSPEWLALKTTVLMLEHRLSRIHRLHPHQSLSCEWIDTMHEPLR